MNYEELAALKEALEQGLAFGRIRITSYDQCWTSHQLTRALLDALMSAKVAQ